jgi:iron-sulfur cluster assembly protein
MTTVTLDLSEGEVLLDRLLEEGVPLTHECGGTLACATCCVVVRTGQETLSPASEDEIDMLDRASVDEPGARLACQAVAGGGEVVVSLLPDPEIPTRAAGTSPVAVTARAAKHLAAQLAKHPGAVAVRLAVEPAGCSGFGYRVDHADEIRADDRVFESAGLRITVDPLSLPYVQGTTIDLVQEGLARKLRFDNPNVRQSCGCGESFGV